MCVRKSTAGSNPALSARSNREQTASSHQPARRSRRDSNRVSKYQVHSPRGWATGDRGFEPKWTPCSKLHGVHEGRRWRSTRSGRSHAPEARVHPPSPLFFWRGSAPPPAEVNSSGPPTRNRFGCGGSLRLSLAGAPSRSARGPNPACLNATHLCKGRTRARAKGQCPSGRRSEFVGAPHPQSLRMRRLAQVIARRRSFALRAGPQPRLFDWSSARSKYWGVCERAVPLPPPK